MAHGCHLSETAYVLHSKAAFLPVFKAIVLGFLLLQGNTITKKASWGGKGYLLYTSIFNSVIGESQGRDLEARADADRGQEKDAVYWFVPHALPRLLCCRTQDRQPRGGIALNGQGPSTSITN